MRYIYIDLKKYKKKNVFIYNWFCFYLKNVILVLYVYYIRDYYVCKNYYYV